MYQSKYVPKYTPPEERDFFWYLDDLKYEETLNNTNNYFKEVKVANFDKINHICMGDLLEKSMHEHLLMKGEIFEKCRKNEKEKVVNGALRYQNKTKQKIYVKKDVV